jgi:pyrroloquinoline quinone biosynthesis protein D
VSLAKSIADDVRPRLPRGVRLRHDEIRERWVLLGPERLLLPEEIAVEVLRLCDGERTVAVIVAELAEAFAAEPAEIRADVEAFLFDLQSQRMIEL